MSDDKEKALYLPLTDISRIKIIVDITHFSLMRQCKKYNRGEKKYYWISEDETPTHFPIEELTAFMAQMPRIEKLLVLK